MLVRHCQILDRFLKEREREQLVSSQVQVGAWKIVGCKMSLHSSFRVLMPKTKRNLYSRTDTFHNTCFARQTRPNEAGQSRKQGN